MRNRTPSARRRHQLVLSLLPHGLHVLHLQRGILGWKRANEASLPLPEGDDFLPKIQSQLSHCIEQWKLPSGARVHWVLAGDILGIVPPSATETSLAAALPFSANDTRTQPDLFAGDTLPSLMWIHKDWIAEIERISSQCQLELVELYARAQLFQRHAAQRTGATKVVIERENGMLILHIFASTGMMLRTRILSDKDATALHAILQTELAGLRSGTDGQADRQKQLLAPAELVANPSEWHGFDCHALEQVSQADLLERLWHSDLEGIVVRPTHDDIVKGIKALSLSMGAAGLVGLGLMVWHDGQLQQQIDDGRTKSRKDLPRVEAAKALKSRTLQMAEAVQAAQTLRENSASMTAFTQILANFPPAPATLLYVRTDDNTLAFVGTGEEASVKWLQERSFPGYEPLTEFPVPEFLQNNNPAIHFQSRKSAPRAAAPSATALPASTAASRTATP
ncbi:MAG: hypothetical protein HUU13_00370 [Burkholderiaceae bacterium]|nr:hypothetical protein [Burkholderiaceae bacterium]